MSDVKKLFMTVSKENEYAFLKTLEANKYEGKIVFVNGHEGNYIVVNGIKYGEISTKNAVVPVIATKAADIVEAIANGGEVNVTISDSIKTEEITIPKGANVTLNIADSATISSNSSTSSIFIVNEGSTLTITGDGTITSTNKVILNSGVINIEGGNFTGDTVISNKDNAVTNISGGNFTAQESAVNCACKNSTINISGGTFNAKDNAVVMDNGIEGRSGNVINITGGTFNCAIESAGYIACGVYVANDEEVNILGGTFNVENGCGVCARAGIVTIDGATFNCTGTNVTGKVGDSFAQIECVPVVFDEASNYPGLTNNSEVIIRKLTAWSSEVVDTATGENVKYCYLKGDKSNPQHLHNSYATDESRINLK